MPCVDTLPRVIPLDTVHNLRDLGGYPTQDGRHTRWRTLFRSDALHRLAWPDARADVETFSELGIRTVIDLRTAGELDTRGRFPVDLHPVTFHHLSFLDVVWDPAEAPSDPALVPGFLTERYLEILDSAGPNVAYAFTALALPGALPAVFHCAAGKDRTGVLAALLLSSLGVRDIDVVADYALTQPAMERMRRWAVQRDADLAEAYASMPAAHLAAEPQAMADVLAHLRAEHGSVREYVRSLGVSNVVLFDLEVALLEA